MDLLERYLQAVGERLPAGTKADTLAELRANLLAEMDDKAEALGRPLTENEAADVLLGHGHPSLVAARYRPQRSLIGPETFPFYWHTMSKVLPWVIVLVVLSRVVGVVYGPPQSHPIMDGFGALFSVLFYFFCWMTLVFAAIDYGRRFFPQKVTLYQEWDPRNLPKVNKEEKNRQDLPKYPMADLWFTCFGLLWLLAVPHIPYLLFGPGVPYLRALPFRPSAAMHTFYWMIVGLNLVQIGMKWLALDAARGLRRWMKLVSDGIGLIPWVILLRTTEYLVFVRPATDAAQIENVATLNMGIHHFVQLITVIVVLQFVKAMWQMAKELFARRSNGHSSVEGYALK
jgi:hypothetical protein